MLRNYTRLPRQVHILCLGAFINRAGSFFVVFLTLYLTRSLGMHPQVATNAMGLFGVGSIVAALVGGQLADQIGRRIVMLIALFGSATIAFTFAFLQSAWTIGAAVFLFALVSDMYRPATSAMIADLVEPERRPYAFGLMYIAINLGFCVAPVVGGILSRYSFRLLFWSDAATSCIYALIVLLTIHETLGGAVRRESDDAGDGRRGEPLASVSFPAALRHIAGDTPFVLFCAATWGLGLVVMQSVSTLPLYLERIGIGAEGYGRIIALNGALIVLFQIPATRLVIHRPRGPALAVASVLFATGFGLTGLARAPVQFAATVVIWTMGELIQAPLTPAVVADLAPASMRARYQGLISMCYAGGMMIGAPLGGMVLTRWGPHLWTTAAGLALLAGLLYFAIRTQISHRVDSPTTDGTSGVFQIQPPGLVSQREQPMPATGPGCDP